MSKQNNENVQYENLCKQIQKNKLIHSIMLISSDKYALQTNSINLAKMLMCENLKDVACNNCVQCKKIEHNNHADVMFFPTQKDNIATDEMLSIIESVQTMPFESDKKIYILNNASSINITAQNKLLKTLEEPPTYVYFILNVTNEANMLSTIKSRCTKIYLSNYNNEEVKKSLQPFNLQPKVQEDILFFANGNIASALNFATNNNFDNIVELVFDLWLNMTHSSKIVTYASKLYSLKKEYEIFTQVFNMLLKQLIEVKTGKTAEYRNEDINTIAQNFSAEALARIAKNAILLNEKMQRNCNFNLMIDTFLISFLEVKNKCQR